ncbi:hypothetical protein J3D56_003912 [Erwinia persicina]|uniref:hypothetical protein n=1 Tax=Erwinia persicina TaxID=55211 RepID=UPI00209C9458|nr:hypothetical protein [Erwinia persicina]MCP1440476.1 hypothetical protein [Erwinia persicina]
MTTEEKARLINLCESSILAHQQYGDESDEKKVYQIALTSLTAEPVAVPEGWRLVPLEPTVEMINAAQSSTAWDRVDFWEGFYDDKAAYQAMLAAAPTP